MNWTLEQIKEYLAREAAAAPAASPVAQPKAVSALDRIKPYLEARGLLRARDTETPAGLLAEMNGPARDDEERSNNLNNLGLWYSTQPWGKTTTPPLSMATHSADRRAESQQQIRDYLLKKRGQDDSLITKAFDDKPDNGAYNMAELERRKAQDLAREKQGAQGLELRGRELDLKEKDIARKANAPPKTPKGSADPSGLPAGYDLDPESHATRRQNEAFEGLVFADNKMRGLTKEMRRLLADAGAGRLLPGSNARIKQLATQIQIEGKNVAELGALSGPDMALMNAIAADPTKLTSVAKDTEELLNGLDAWGRNSVSSKASSIGARPRASSAPTPTPGDLVTVIDAETGEPLEVSAEEAASMIKHGLARPQ